MVHATMWPHPVAYFPKSNCPPVVTVVGRSTQASRAIERRTATLMSDAMSGRSRAQKPGPALAAGVL